MAYFFALVVLVALVTTIYYIVKLIQDRKNETKDEGIKKKLYISAGVTVVAFLITGITAPKDENKNASNQSSAQSSQSSSNQQSSKTESSSSSSQDTNKVGFSNGVAVLDDVTMEITDHKVIQPGEAGNEYSDKPVFAVWYKVTNKTDKEINPMTAWMSVFNAYQDNDPNKENKLGVSSLPDSRFSDSQMANIKKGGTVENAMAYKLTDTTTPVQLVAKQGFFGGKLGEQTFEIK
ncbi:DUF5067 domain-containing protein [Holzapfeliella sp. He02]|uniref:DUF5067 domain-containing protein n=1 Tax=Holzapfeliella saturejae TaxID=3082953 RepID=A0ABU8SHG1_9LACO